jgi:hypothetical protein
MKLALILLILLILASYNFNYKIELFVDNNKNWNSYRLGDIIKCWNHIKYQKWSWEYYESIPKKFPDSIGAEYVKQNKNKIPSQFNILKSIIEVKLKKCNIKELDFVLHLRLGDAITGYNEQTDILAYNGEYATKLETIEKNIDIFKGKNVHIFYGNHVSWANLKYSEIYLKKLRKLFNKHNIGFIEVKSGNPDTDFLHMCKAKEFVKSGGGYSNLIETIRKKNNKSTIRL